MATRTQSRSSNQGNKGRRQPRNSDGEFTSRSTTSRGAGERSAFSWGDSAGPVIGAALAGLAVGFAATYGR